MLFGLCPPWQWMGYVGMRLQEPLLPQAIEFQGRLPNKIIPPSKQPLPKGRSTRNG
jgi:hypothetical protein